MELFSRLRDNSELAKPDSNAPSSFMYGDERKALKQAKEAERAFCESKGLKPDTFWRRCFKKLKRND